MVLRKRQIDTTIEQRILTGFIVSTAFCKKVLPIAKEVYFTNSYGRRVFGWVKEYFNKYEKAPFRDIQLIFETERSKLKSDEAELIEQFLLKLSEQYENEESINYDYFVDQALTYFRKRSLEVLADQLKVALMRDHVEEAERLLDSYKDIAKEVSGWEDPFASESIWEVFEKESDQLFTFPGALGEMVGPLERGQLVGVMGSMKKGKSWVLQEFAIQAVAAKLRTVYISLEMPSKQVKARLLKRIAGKGFQEILYYPCFDCKKNQSGSCMRSERTSTVPLLVNGKLPSPEEAPPDYQPCTYCRDRGLSEWDPAVWYTFVKIPPLTYPEAVRKVKSFKTMFGDRIRVKSYPSFSATLRQILSDLENLEYTEDFPPDVIVVDYADIIAPSRFVGEERTGINEIWKQLKRLAMEKKCLVVTATQTNRGGIRKAVVTEEDTAEDIRKLAHVDLLLTLNQTPLEKRLGMLRIGVLVRREGDFSHEKQVAVLTNWKAGQLLLDSEWWDAPEEEKNEN